MGAKQILRGNKTTEVKVKKSKGMKSSKPKMVGGELTVFTVIQVPVTKV